MVSNRSSDVAHKDSASHTLLLDEGVLVGPDGLVEPLWSVDDKDEMRAAAQDVSERAWPVFEPAGTESADQLGAVVAAASKLDVYWDFCSYFRNARLLERSVQRVNPSVIEWRVDAVLPRVGTSAVVKSSRMPALAKKAEGGATAWLKRTKWEWSARALAGLLERSGAHASPEAGIDVLGVFDVRNAGMVQSVGSVIGHISRLGGTTVGVSMHAQVTKQARTLSGVDDMRPLVKFSRVADVWQALRVLPAVERAVRRFGSATHSDLDPAVDDAAQDALRGLHAGYILQTLLDYRAMGRMLDALRPKSIVLASDAHRYSRLMVAAAAKRQVPTFVLQHGAPAQAHFFTPVVADYMLAWGPWCRTWFLDRGTPERKVHAVGFVRARERKEFPTAARRATKLLFAAQPISDHVTEELLGMLRQALELSPALTVTVRPHPGEGRRSAIHEMLGRWPQEAAARCSVSPPGHPLELDLNEADVVVTAQSTMGIDALAGGVPVFLLGHPQISEPIPFREFGCVVEVGSAVDLVDGLASMEDPDFMSALATATDRFLEAYVGRAGNAALSEASRLIMELASAEAASA